MPQNSRCKSQPASCSLHYGDPEREQPQAPPASPQTHSASFWMTKPPQTCSSMSIKNLPRGPGPCQSHWFGTNCGPSETKWRGPWAGHWRRVAPSGLMLPGTNVCQPHSHSMQPPPICFVHPCWHWGSHPRAHHRHRARAHQHHPFH